MIIELKFRRKFSRFPLVSSFFFLSLWRCGPTRAMASLLLRFIDHTKRHTTVGKSTLNEWSARRKDLYLTTHKTLKRRVHAPGGIRTHNLTRRVAADPRLRPRYYWDWPFRFKAVNYDYCINSSFNQEPCCAVTTSTVHVYLYNRSSTHSLLNESSAHVTQARSRIRVTLISRDIHPSSTRVSFVRLHTGSQL
jgi:hypothetical protein